MVSVSQKLPQHTDGSVDLDAWCQRMLNAQDLAQGSLDSDALLEAARWLQSIPDAPLTQGLELAELVLELRLDQASILAALCYNGLRKGLFDADELSERIGDEATQLVLDVSAMATSSLLEISDPNLQASDQQRQIENIKRMLVALVRDFRAAVIKLGERLLVLRHAKRYDEARRERIAQEAAAIFAPLASRLGMWQLKWELEDLSLRYLREDIYLGVAKQLSNKRQAREAQIQQLVEQIQQLLDSVGVRAEVKGRAKNIFSIWRKMQQKNIPLEQVYDVRAVRVVVKNLADCYAALGVIHSTWQHIPSQFDDYIAAPKENGYQSIHTAITADDGRTLEVQIRTQQMHESAELGVCAHWAYKDDKDLRSSHSSGNDHGYDAKMDWLRQAMEWHDELGGSEDLASILAQRVSEDRIYVATPKGHVLDLASGATVLDFAYRIHTEIGHSCYGGRVNGVRVPVDMPLHSGEQVEVLTGGALRPHRAWLESSLGYLHTHRAKANVVSFFRGQTEEKRQRLGKVILQSVFSGAGARLLDDNDWQLLASFTTAPSVEQLFDSIATGERSYIDTVAPILESLDRQRQLKLWLDRPDGASISLPNRVHIRLVANNREGLLRDVTDQLARLSLQIVKASGEVKDQSLAMVDIEVDVISWKTLLQAMSRLAYLTGVYQVRRTAMVP